MAEPDTKENEALLAKFDELKGFFGEYHSNVDINRKYYDLKFSNTVVPPAQREDIPALIPPTARQAIDEATDHILFTPRVRVPTRPSEAGSSTEENIAAKKREFADAYWAIVAQKFNPIGDGRKVFLNEGRICVKQVIDWQKIPDKPKRKTKKATEKFRAEMGKLGRDEFLWTVELLDNKTVFEDPSDHRNPQYVYIEGEVLTEEAKRVFPDAEGEWTKGGDFDVVRHLEYWDHDRFVQWIGTERVDEGDNPYPYIPIAIEDNGYGTVRRNSSMSEKYVGLTQFTQDMFVAEARQMTSMEVVAEISAFAMITTRNIPSSQQIKVGPGVINPLEGAENDPQRQSIEFLQWPDIPQGVLQLLQKTEQLANGALKFNTLGGIPLPGVETATEADQQIRNATAKLSSPLAGLARLAKKLTEWAFIDIEFVLEAPVTLAASGGTNGEVTLTPRDLSGFHAVSVEFRTTDEEAVNMNKARFWGEMTRLIPFLSYTTAMVTGEISDDPQAEMTRRAAEDAYLSDEFRFLRTASAAEDLGQFMQMVKALAAQQGLAPSAAPGGPGGPAPVPGAAPVGAAVATQETALQPLEARAQAARDVTQGASQLRGGNGQA